MFGGPTPRTSDAGRDARRLRPGKATCGRGEDELDEDCVGASAGTGPAPWPRADVSGHSVEIVRQIERISAERGPLNSGSSPS